MPVGNSLLECTLLVEKQEQQSLCSLEKAVVSKEHHFEGIELIFLGTMIIHGLDHWYHNGLDSPSEKKNVPIKLDFYY